MKSFECVCASVACSFLLVSSHAFGAPPFPKAIEVLHIKDEGVYSTDWTVYPIRVERINLSNRKPEEMILGLFEDGKDGGFEGIVEINCDQPVKSYVSTGSSGVQQFDEVSLKDMMKSDVLPRELVTNVFALFCKDSPLNSANLNISHE